MDNEQSVIDLIVIDEEMLGAQRAGEGAKPKQQAKRRGRVMAVTAAVVLLALLGLFAVKGIEHINAIMEENRRCEEIYLSAMELIEAGEQEEAQSLLAEIRGYRDSSEILSGIICSKLYEQGTESMAREDYGSARCSFQSLGDFRDAREKAEECRILEIREEIYREGSKLYKENKWGEAYQKLASIRGTDYKDTDAMMDDIAADATEYAHEWAQEGEMSKTLAFVSVVEKIDPEQGAALRSELIGESSFTPNQSFYLFDTTHITAFTANTPVEDFATVVIYMLLHGKLEIALMSNKAVDHDVLEETAFHGADLAQEMLPGYGSIYNPSVLVGENYVNYYMNYEQQYSEHQRTVHLKTFKSFCEESVRKMTEMGLLSDTMTRRQKAEVIINWVGFYLTYDKSLKIHDVGVAIESKRGVCEAFAALYCRMCNLAGIPTYGQVGDVPSGNGVGRHIWSFHVDEEGKIFYADATWCDLWDIDFGATGAQEPTLELFREEYLTRCLAEAVAEKTGQWIDRPEVAVYGCSEKLWLTHKPDRDAEEIIAYHAGLTGQAA